MISDPNSGDSFAYHIARHLTDPFVRGAENIKNAVSKVSQLTIPAKVGRFALGVLEMIPIINYLVSAIDKCASARFASKKISIIPVKPTEEPNENQESGSNTESSKTESSQNESSKTESSKTESSQNESSKTESSQTESSQTESSKTESSQNEKNVIPNPAILNESKENTKKSDQLSSRENTDENLAKPFADTPTTDQLPTKASFNSIHLSSENTTDIAAQEAEKVEELDKTENINKAEEIEEISEPIEPKAKSGFKETAWKIGKIAIVTLLVLGAATGLGLVFGFIRPTHQDRSIFDHKTCDKDLTQFTHSKHLPDRPNLFGLTLANERCYASDQLEQINGVGELIDAQGNVMTGPFVRGVMKGEGMIQLNFHQDGIKKIVGNFDGDTVKDGVIYYSSNTKSYDIGNFIKIDGHWVLHGKKCQRTDQYGVDTQGEFDKGVAIEITKTYPRLIKTIRGMSLDEWNKWKDTKPEEWKSKPEEEQQEELALYDLGKAQDGIKIVENNEGIVLNLWLENGKYVGKKTSPQGWVEIGTFNDKDELEGLGELKLPKGKTPDFLSTARPNTDSKLLDINNWSCSKDVRTFKGVFRNGTLVVDQSGEKLKLPIQEPQLDYNEIKQLELAKIHVADGNEIEDLKIPSGFENDRDVIFAMIKKNPGASACLSSQQHTKDVVLEIIKRGKVDWSRVSKEVIEDEEVLLAALEKENNENNKGIISALLQAEQSVIKNAKSESLKDSKFMLKAIKMNAIAITFADKTLLNSQTFLDNAFKQNLEVIFLNSDMQHDKEKALVALRDFSENKIIERGGASFFKDDVYLHLSKELQEDPEILKAANRQNSKYFAKDYILNSGQLNSLTNDKNFMILAIKRDYSLFQMSSENLLKDPQYLEDAFKADCRVIRYNEKMQDDLEKARIAVEKDIEMYQYLSEKVKNDETMISFKEKFDKSQSLWGKLWG